MKDIRTYNDVSQKEIAQKLGLSNYTYSHYETEYQIMPITHIIVFCDYFDISIDYLFSFTDKNQYTNIVKNLSNKTAGERLKLWRKENKLTQAKLASILNTTQAVIANYERGRNLIATPFLYDICKKYKISADYLLGRIDEPKYLK